MNKGFREFIQNLNNNEAATNNFVILILTNQCAKRVISFYFLVIEKDTIPLLIRRSENVIVLIGDTYHDQWFKIRMFKIVTTTFLQIITPKHVHLK